MVESNGKIGFINTLFYEGNINTLYGPPGSGKTNLAVFLMEKAVDLGYEVWTIIHFFKYAQIAEACSLGRLPVGITYKRIPPEVHTVTTFSELLLGLLNGRKNIVVLDEAGIFASSTAPMQNKVRELKELAYVIRHLNSSLLLIAQSKGSISPTLRSELVTYELRIRKLSKYYRTLTVSKAKEVMNDEGEQIITFVPIGPTISKIPLTRYPWDGYFIPKFKFDIKLEDAFNRLGDYNSVEVLREGPRLIKELMESSKEKEDVKVNKENKRDEIRNKFLTMAESGNYTKRSDIFAELARENKRTYNWAYQLCRDLPF